VPADRLGLARSLNEVVCHFYPFQNLDFTVTVSKARDDMPESINIVLDILTVSSGEAFERT
jgi:hypothetical protein